MIETSIWNQFSIWAVDPCMTCEHATGKTSTVDMQCCSCFSTWHESLLSLWWFYYSALVTWDTRPVGAFQSSRGKSYLWKTIHLNTAERKGGSERGWDERWEGGEREERGGKKRGGKQWYSMKKSNKCLSHQQAQTHQHSPFFKQDKKKWKKKVCSQLACWTTWSSFETENLFFPHQKKKISSFSKAIAIEAKKVVSLLAVLP